MPLKIGFKVMHASGYDDGVSPLELETHGPTVKGWVSARFCLFPQEVIFRLEDRCRIRKLQILSHQYLVPQKIEFFIGEPPSSETATLHNIKYRRLGYVALSDNEKTNFKARELKSVHVDAVGQYIKLIIYKNHVNRYNLFNQVGIVAVNTIGDIVGKFKEGEKVDPAVQSVIHSYMPAGFKDNLDKDENGLRPRSDLPLDDPMALGVVTKPDYISPLDDLAFSMYQDPEVAEIIRKLDSKKQQAVKQEKFEYAKKLKQAITDLQKVGERLGKYEVEKRRAIEMEDYDLAKQKKDQMDEYRKHINDQLKTHHLLDDKQQLTSKPEEEKPPPPTTQKKEEKKDEKKAQPPPKEKQKPQRNKPKETPAVHTRSDTTQTTPPDSQDKKRNDERPLPVTVRKSPPAVEEEQPPEEEPEETEQAQPEPLTEKQMREAGAVIEVFGLSMVAGAYSKTWSYREDALLAVYKILYDSPETTGKIESSNMMKNAIFLVRRAILDKVTAVFHAAVQLLRMILVEFIPKHNLPKQDTIHAVEKTLPNLLTKTGETNTRQRQAAKDFINDMALMTEVQPLQIIPHHGTVPFKSQIPARAALSRVEIVEQLLKDLGVNDTGLRADNVMPFCVRSLEHNAIEVREAAVRVILDLYRHVGDECREHLPADNEQSRKSVLYKTIFEGFDRIDGKPSEEDLRSERLAAEEKKQSEIRSLQDELQSLKEATSSRYARSEIGDDTTITVDGTGNGSGATGGDINIHINVHPSSSKDGQKSPTKSLMSKRSAPPSELGDDGSTTVDYKLCIFCGEKNDNFNEEGIDFHYWKECPMLKRCQHCRQVVEISNLSEHLLTECDKKDDFAKCPRCTEAIPKSEIDKHVQEKSCMMVKGDKSANHCPLCHQNIVAGDEGWKMHLMAKDGCKENPRRVASINRRRQVKVSKPPKTTVTKPTGGTTPRKR